MGTKIKSIMKIIVMRNSIIRNIFLTFVITNFIIGAVLGAVMIQGSTKALTDEAVYYNYKVVEQSALSLNNMIDEIKEPLYILSKDKSVIASMRNEEMDIAEELKHRMQIKEVSTNVSQFKPVIRDILILGKNGYYSNLISGKRINWDYDFTTQSWFQQSIQSEEIKIVNLGLHKQDYYTDEYYKNQREYTVSLAIPVLDYVGNVIGSIVCNLELNKIEDIFTSNPYDRGELYLLGRDNQILVHENSTLLGTRLSLAGNPLAPSEATSFQQKINGKDSIGVAMPTTIKDWKLVQIVNMAEVTQSTQTLRENLFHILLLYLVINILLTLIISWKVYKPLKNFLLNLRVEETLEMEKKNYKFEELNQIQNTFVDLLKRIRELVKTNYLSTLALKQSELKSLHSQMNPHVIFNTLQLLQTEIVFGNKQASNQLILSLSNLLRYSMNQTDKLIEVKKEISYIKDYVYIMNKKFNDKITLDLCIPEEILQSMILKLTLQPIVENSIKHGLREGSGRILIKGESFADRILFTVIDDGVGIESGEVKRLNELLGKEALEPESIGLYNVNQRLKLKFGNDYGIKISCTDRGTEVKILIPEVGREEIAV